MGNSYKINCTFCKIITNDEYYQFLFEDERMILIKDIKPYANIHFLAIPKRHIKNINYTTLI